MNIHNSKYIIPLSLETPRTPQSATDAAASSKVQSVPATPSSTDKSDKVQISDAGRALAARATGDTDAVSQSSLDPAKADRVRSRILSGAYDTVEVVDAVARRLLATGDV
jgi:negative regulator of flagellin synthesis FlgM